MSEPSAESVAPLCAVCGEELEWGQLDQEDYGPGEWRWWHKGYDPKQEPRFHWAEPLIDGVVVKRDYNPRPQGPEFDGEASG